MRFSPSISTLVFDELLTTLEVIGVENTIKTLREAKTKNSIYSNVDFIINTVSEVTGVDRERILHGIDRNDERKIALSLAIFYIKKEYSYGYSELKKIFNRDRAALSRYHSLVENLPATPKSDIDKKLKNYTKKINFFIEKNKK